MSKLESGYYLEMKTGPEWSPSVMYVGPYPTKEKADADSDRFTDTPMGEHLLHSFMVESIKTKEAGEIDARHITNFPELFEKPDALA